MITYRNVIVTRSKEIINVGQTKALSSTKARPKLERGSKLDQGLSEALTRLVQSSNEARPNAATFEKKLSKLWRLLPKPPPLEIWSPPLSLNFPSSSNIWRLKALLQIITLPGRLQTRCIQALSFCWLWWFKAPFCKLELTIGCIFLDIMVCRLFILLFTAGSIVEGYISPFRSPLHLLKSVEIVKKGLEEA